MRLPVMVLCAATLGGACASAAVDTPPPASVAPRSTAAVSTSPRTPTKRSGPPIRCGEVTYVRDCPADRHAKFECLVRALEECEPATLRINLTTIEGGKVMHDYSVTTAADGSCSVDARYDERGDKFGGNAHVTTSRCKGIKVLGIPGCTTLGLDGC